MRGITRDKKVINYTLVQHCARCRFEFVSGEQINFLLPCKVQNLSFEEDFNQ